MLLETIAEIYINYIEPGFKFFAMFMAVLFVMAFWAKAKDGQIIDISAELFRNLCVYTYQFFYYIFLAIYMVFNAISRVFRVIFATVRDFFISRI